MKAPDAARAALHDATILYSIPVGQIHDSGEGSVQLWDTTSCQEVAALREHSGLLLSLSFRPDSPALATASADATAKVWDVAALRKKPQSTAAR